MASGALYTVGFTVKVCSVEDCAKPPRSKNSALCEMHYHREYRARKPKVNREAKRRWRERNGNQELEYRKRNRKRKAAYDRKRREENAEHVREIERATYLRNREKKLAYARRWREANRERQKQHRREYYLANRDRIRAAGQRWHEANPDRAQAYAANRRARVAGAKIEPVIPREIFKRDDYCCQICGRATAGVHPSPFSPSLDHIIPLSKGGDHSTANVQCACLRCNLSKNDALPESAMGCGAAARP